MKDNFFLPAIIFIVAIGLIAAYGFAVQTGYAASRIIDNDYSEVYRGLVVNNYGATNGLLVPNGNVGIGTNSPLSKLSVGGVGNNSAAIFALGDSSGVYGMSNTPTGAGVLGQSTGGNGVHGKSWTGNAIYGETITSGYAGYFVGDGYFSGNVGIGVTNPQSKLTVVSGGGIGTGMSNTSIYGDAISLNGIGVYGVSSGVNGVGIYGWNGTAGGLAGKFGGDVMVQGTIFSKGRWQDCGTCATNQLYSITSERYVMDLKSADVGVAEPLDTAVIDRLCRDIDGCELTITMMNAIQGIGMGASYKFYPSEISNWWALSITNPSNPAPIDNNNAVSEISYGDCYFGDFDTSTNTNNGRTDAGIGFGFLNVKVGDWSDFGVTCRLIITD